MHIQILIFLSLVTFSWSVAIVEKLPPRSKTVTGKQQGNAAVVQRQARQVVEDVTVIEDTIVPDVVGPTGPVVDTVTEIQDTIVPDAPQFSPFGVPQGFYRKREFQTKFQFFTPANNTVTDSKGLQIRPAVAAFLVNSSPTRLPNASKGNVVLHKGQLTTTTTTAVPATTNLIGLTSAPSTSSERLQTTSFPVSSIRDPSDLTSAHLVVTATSTFFPSIENIITSFTQTTTPPLQTTKTPFRAAVPEAITFTVTPLKRLAWKVKKTAAEGSPVFPMSRENQEIYAIAGRADNTTGTLTNPSAIIIERNQTITSTNGTTPFVIASQSVTSILTGAALRTSSKPLVRDEEPPVTQHQLDLAAERALLLPAKMLEITNATAPVNGSIFAEFKPRSFFQ